MNSLVGQYVGRASPELMRERVLQYLPLVKHIVRRFAMHLPRHVDLDDLESVGVEGLMEAVRRFDPTRGASLKTFAYEHIRGAILGDLRKRDIVTRSMRRRIRELERVEAEISGRLGRMPFVGEIAAAMDLSEDEVEEIQLARHTHSVLSLDRRDPGQGGRSLVSGLVSPRTRRPDDIAAGREEVSRLADAIEELPEIEQKVIVLYYSKGLLQRQIGEVLGVTESRVCQIHARAVKRLERTLRERGHG
jgi:RNA polymerase sigma factor for flagellar operon FliA